MYGPMQSYSHTVTLDLNITGYDGSDLDAVVPHFMTERDTKLVLSWASSAEGPESFRFGYRDRYRLCGWKFL